MKIHAFRLHPNQDLKLSISSYLSEKSIPAGLVLGTVGSLQRASVRLANRKDATIMDGKFEILTLSGTLSVNGSHLHISIADENGSVFGGHLMEGCIIFTTAEIVIGELDHLEFSRTFDKHTGFSELDIRHK